MSQPIQLNTAVFHANRADATQATHSAGWYRLTPGGVIFYDLQGERIGGVNKHGCMYASGMAYGKLWHNYADIKGVGPMSYGDKCRASDRIMEIWREHFQAATA